VKIISVSRKGLDVIAEILQSLDEEWILTSKQEKQIATLLHKIQQHIKYFIDNGCILDGDIAKPLEQWICEFRVSIPKSQYLLRILFHYKVRSLIFLTSYLVKPKEYDKKHSQKNAATSYYDKIIYSVEWVKKYENKNIEIVDITDFVL
jgi:hypothetical protein